MGNVVKVKNSRGQMNPELEAYIKSEIEKATKAKIENDSKIESKRVQSNVMRFPKLKAMIQDGLDAIGIKSILTTKEIMNLSLLNNSIARIEDVIKMAISPYERKMLRTAQTFIEKSILSIYERSRESTRQEINSIENTCFPVLVHKAEYEHLKECVEHREKVIEKAWEDVLDISEAVMQKCCQGCKDNPMECVLYHKFTRHHFEECTGANSYRGRKCKYGYVKKDGKIL